MKTEWDLSPLFKDNDDPEMEKQRHEIRTQTDGFILKWKDRADWLSNPGILAEAMREYETWHRTSAFSDEYYYFILRTSENESDPALKAKYGKVEEFSNAITTDMQFFTLRLARVSAELQQVFLNAPELAAWKHFLERLFAESKYLLSEPEEKIMVMKAAPAHDSWDRMTSGFLSREEADILLEDGSTAKKTLPELLTLTQSQSKTVRDQAAMKINAILRKYDDVAEAEMNAIMLNKKIDDALRGLLRPDALRHLNDDVDSEVVDTLVDAVAARFDIPQRYYALKAKLLGLPQLAYHERMVPYGAVGKPYTFEEAYALTYKVFSELDPVFAGILERFVKNGQIDVFPHKNKRSGAFCIGPGSRLPTYILLNYGNTLEEVTTLAHEMGHGINNELMREKQSELDYGVLTSTAEVASIFMEDFILEEVVKTADNETKLAIMMMRLNDATSSVFRQVACYRFETELHNSFRAKGYLSKQEIGALFQKHMAAYMGLAVAQPEDAKNWWIYWEHIRDFFYVYSYAAGHLIGSSLQAGVKADHGFIEKVKTFLAAGLSESPRDIFKKTGIDIADRAFWEQGIGEIEKLLVATEELAKKLGKA
jgi:oligoendopeptidase F